MNNFRVVFWRIFLKLSTKFDKFDIKQNIIYSSKIIEFKILFFHLLISFWLNQNTNIAYRKHDRFISRGIIIKKTHLHKIYITYPRRKRKMLKIHLLCRCFPKIILFFQRIYLFPFRRLISLIAFRSA